MMCARFHQSGSRPMRGGIRHTNMRHIGRTPLSQSRLKVLFAFKLLSKSPFLGFRFPIAVESLYGTFIVCCDRWV